MNLIFLFDVIRMLFLVVDIRQFCAIGAKVCWKAGGWPVDGSIGGWNSRKQAVTAIGHPENPVWISVFTRHIAENPIPPASYFPALTTKYSRYNSYAQGVCISTEQRWQTFVNCVYICLILWISALFLWVHLWIVVIKYRTAVLISGK